MRSDLCAQGRGSSHRWIAYIVVKSAIVTSRRVDGVVGLREEGWSWGRKCLLMAQGMREVMRMVARASQCEDVQLCEAFEFGRRWSQINSEWRGRPGGCARWRGKPGLSESAGPAQPAKQRRGGPSWIRIKDQPVAVAVPVRVRLSAIQARVSWSAFYHLPLTSACSSQDAHFRPATALEQIMLRYDGAQPCRLQRLAM